MYLIGKKKAAKRKNYIAYYSIPVHCIAQLMLCLKY